MGRWEPDAAGRLQLAAMTLFQERGYPAVTVTEIAERAGVTKRTFFNHFTDKREVLFAGAEDFQTSVVAHVLGAGQELEPIESALQALTRGGLELSGYREYARARRELIASSTELQERDLIKTNTLASAIAGALRERQVPARVATLTAQAAVAVFNTAYADWVDSGAADFETLVQRALVDLREAVG